MKKQFPFALAILFLAAGCAHDTQSVVATPNTDAGLSGDLPFNPLQWQVITSEINPAASTMSTLYGNDPAVRYARSHSLHDYPAGSVLALVTWGQKEDQRWFGANIPGKVISVEVVSLESTPDKKPVASYHRYEGAPLQKSAALDDSAANTRAAYILAQRPAVMP